jgi:PKD repeat protein
MYYFNRDSLQPLKIAFHENAIGDSLTYLWAFGDGTFSNDSNPIKTFSQGGNYSVCLTVQRHPSLGVSTFCSTINLGQFVNNCYSSFIIDINNKVYYPRVLGSPAQNNKCAFIWDFGDGNKIRQTHHYNFPAYQYQDAGNYLICLDVYDTIDVSFNSRSCRVLVVPPYMAANKCTAKFSFLKKGSPLSNYFSAFSNYEPTEAQYFWTFGDGDTSSSKNPLHTFKENGTYTICLNVRAISDTCNQTFCETHTFKDSTVGIDSYLPFETFTIYPNPTNDRIKIKQNTNFDLGVTDITISDESGRILLNRKLAEGTSKDDVSIELSELQNGIYFILINSEKGSTHYKFLKF